MSDDVKVETPKPEKRGAIVGTAPSWKQTPWHDTTLDIYSLNDAYVLGIPRVTGWFDLHPIHEMSFHRGRKVSHLETPVGAYLRPEGHLEWLKTRPFPVFLQDVPQGWANARAFPFEQIQQQYGRYFASTPAWMLAWMLSQGYTEIHIYGIHLATEWEYVRQRPNLEFLIGMALARGVKFVIPEQSTLLKSPFVYALEHKPDVPADAVQREIAIIKARGQHLRARHAKLPWYARGEKRDLEEQIRVIELELADQRSALHRVQALAAVG